MNATSGDGLRCAVPVIIAIVALGLSACSGSDSDPVVKPSASATPSADQGAADEQAIIKLAKDVWAARQEAYNSGSDSPALFEGIYSTAATEIELGMLRTYQEQKLLRTGAPVITDVEARVTGETGMIYLCLNEDDWDATENGQVVDTPPRGANPWGASVERSADGWVLVQDQPTADVEKEKSC